MKRRDELAFPQPMAISPEGEVQFPGYYGALGGMTVREHAAIQIASALAEQLANVPAELMDEAVPKLATLAVKVGDAVMDKLEAGDTSADVPA